MPRVRHRPRQQHQHRSFPYNDGDYDDDDDVNNGAADTMPGLNLPEMERRPDNDDDDDYIAVVDDNENLRGNESLLPSHSGENTVMASLAHSHKQRTRRSNNTLAKRWKSVKEFFHGQKQKYTRIDGESGGVAHWKLILNRFYWDYYGFAVFYIVCVISILLLVFLGSQWIASRVNENRHATGKIHAHDKDPEREFFPWEPAPNVTHNAIHSKEHWKRADDVTEQMLHYMDEHEHDCLTARHIIYNYNLLVLRRYVDRKFVVMWNPEVTQMSGKITFANETSDILPGNPVLVRHPRPSTAIVEYIDWSAPNVATIKKYRTAIEQETRCLLHCTEVLSGRHYLLFVNE